MSTADVLRELDVRQLRPLRVSERALYSPRPVAGRARDAVAVVLLRLRP